MVAIRTNRASQFADTEHDLFLEPLANCRASHELVSLRSLSDRRDEAVHPVLEELNGNLVGCRGDARGGHCIHHHLEIDVWLHADTLIFEGIHRNLETFGGVERNARGGNLFVVVVVDKLTSIHFRYPF